MEEKRIRSGNSGNNKTASTIVIFLAVLSILLAVGGAVILRQLFSIRYETEMANREVQKLTIEKESLMVQLDELDAKYVELSEKYQELEGLFAAERRRVNQLRAQLRGEPSGATGEIPNIAQYRQRIQELEEQLESYQLRLESIEEERDVLAGENAQIRTSLAQTTAQNQQLESKNKELEEQVEKASALTISGLDATALRERRRGDEPTDRARRTDKLRICFNVNENLVAQRGNRDFFIRLINPNNMVLSTAPDNTLVFEGETIQYSLKRTVNYQNNPMEVCAIWNQDERFEKGYYNVVVFHDEREVGYKLFQLD